MTKIGVAKGLDSWCPDCRWLPDTISSTLPIFCPTSPEKFGLASLWMGNSRSFDGWAYSCRMRSFSPIQWWVINYYFWIIYNSNLVDSSLYSFGKSIWSGWIYFNPFRYCHIPFPLLNHWCDISWPVWGTTSINFTIMNRELQNFEQIDDYNTLASPFFNQTEGFGRLVSQLNACNISFFVWCCGIFLEGSRMARSQKQGVAKLLSRCVT